MFRGVRSARSRSAWRWRRPVPVRRCSSTTPPARWWERRSLERVLEAVSGDPTLDAAIAAAPVSDTIKRVDADGRVLETLDRSSLWAVQTPQVFRRPVLERALDAGPEELARATDDAWLVERLGGSVAVVSCDEQNFKVTTAGDLRLAELVLAERSAGSADPD